MAAAARRRPWQRRQGRLGAGACGGKGEGDARTPSPRSPWAEAARGDGASRTSGRRRWRAWRRRCRPGSGSCGGGVACGGEGRGGGPFYGRGKAVEGERGGGGSQRASRGAINGAPAACGRRGVAHGWRGGHRVTGCLGQAALCSLTRRAVPRVMRVGGHRGGRRRRRGSHAARLAGGHGSPGAEAGEQDSGSARRDAYGAAGVALRAASGAAGGAATWSTRGR